MLEKRSQMRGLGASRDYMQEPKSNLKDVGKIRVRGVVIAMQNCITIHMYAIELKPEVGSSKITIAFIIVITGDNCYIIVLHRE